MDQDIYSVDSNSLRILLKLIKSRMDRYKRLAKETQDEEEQRQFAHAVGTLIVLRSDLEAILAEIDTSSPVSAAAKREVENLLNDVLIERKTKE